jgi:teichuronic acid exporter
MTLRSQALSGFRWSVSARLASQVVTWAITLVVIRLLTPADYGLLAMATVFITFAAIFSEVGLGAAVVQKADVDERLLRRVFGVILAIHFSLAALLALAAPLIAAFYGEPRVVPVIRVLSLQFVLAAFTVVPDAQLQRRMEFRNRSLLDLSGAILGSLTTLTMAFAGAGVWALIAGSLLSQTWKTIGINWLSPFLHWPDFSVKGMRSLLTFGGHLTAAGVFGVFYSQIDTIICAKLLGNEILGIYSVAVHLASLPSQKISALINAVAFPAFSNMQHNIRKVGENVLLGIRILSFFSFPLCWGMSSIAPEIVDVILGPKWEFSRVPLQVLALIIPWRIVGNFVGIAVQGVGRSDIVLQNTIWGSLVAPPVLFVGAYSGGLIGLSLVWLVVSPLVFLPFLMRSAPVIGLRSKLILAAMVPAAGAGFIMYGVVIAARYMLADWQPEVLRMCILIAAGALAYCAVSFGLNRAGSREVLEMLRSIATTKRV